MSREARDWPNNADGARMDIIALADDVQVVAQRIQIAVDARDEKRIMELSEKLYYIGERQKQIMREARRCAA